MILRFYESIWSPGPSVRPARVDAPQVQNPTLALVDPHAVGGRPGLQFVQVPLRVSSVSGSSQVSVLTKLINPSSPASKS